MANATAYRVYGGESAEDRVQKRQEQFLDAGLQLFGTVGYKGTSVRALCREAKLTDRYFYESFESVEDVLIGVYERETQRIVIEVLQAIGNPTEGASIEVVARPALTALFKLTQNPHVCRTVWFETLGVSDRVNQVYQSTTHEFGEMLLLMIRNLYPAVRTNTVKDELLVMGIVGAINQTVMTWYISGYTHCIDDLVDVNVMLIEGVAQRMQTPA